jgi:hypothetical protein
MQFQTGTMAVVVDCFCIVRSTQKINEIKRECPATIGITLPRGRNGEAEKSSKSCGETSSPAETSGMP